MKNSLRNSIRLSVTVISMISLAVMFSSYGACQPRTGFTKLPVLDGIGGGVVRYDKIYIAVSRHGSVQVINIKDGLPSTIVWDAQHTFPRSKIMGYGWIGSKLILSRVTSPRKLQDLSDAEEAALETSRGDTIAVDIPSGTWHVIYSESFSIISGNPTGEYLAMASPTDGVSLGALVNFFRVDTMQIIGTYHPERGGLLSYNGNYLIGWGADSRGVYLTANRQNETSDGRLSRRLIFVSRDGKAQNLLPESESVMTAGRDDVPSSTLTLDGMLAIAIRSRVRTYYAVVGQSGTVKEEPWKTIIGDWHDSANGYQIICLSPNARFALVQMLTSRAHYNDASPIWVVDIKAQRKRLIGIIGPVSATLHWWDDGLIAYYGETVDGLAGHFALFRVEGADWPADDPRLDALVAAAPWVDCHPEEKALEHTLSAPPRRRVGANFIGGPAIC